MTAPGAPPPLSMPPSLFAVVTAWVFLAAPPSDPPESRDSGVPRGDARRARRVAGAAFSEGVAAFERGDFDTATAAFSAADDWLSHPHTRFNLGLALRAAGRHVEAWAVLRSVEGESEDMDERAEVRRELEHLEDELALLTVVSRPESRLCLDGARVAPDTDGRATMATRPGHHVLVVDGTPLHLELAKGRERVLHLEHARQLLTTPNHPATTPLVGVTAGTALLTTGLGIAALSVSRDDRRAQLGGVAIGTAAVAGATGLAALILSGRRDERRTAGSDGSTPPDEPALGADARCTAPSKAAAEGQPR